MGVNEEKLLGGAFLSPAEESWTGFSGVSDLVAKMDSQGRKVVVCDNGTGVSK